MPIPRPKILSVITVPTGGWTIKIYRSQVVSFDTSFTAVLPAGDYFMAFDLQSDDFLWKLQDVINVAATYHTGNGINFWIDPDTHKAKLAFVDSYYAADPARDVKIAWPENDGASIANALGFDGSADYSSTGVDYPVLTGDWHHAYGWYADEDGSLGDLSIEDVDNPEAEQSVAPSGHVKTHYIASRYTNSIALQFVPRDKMFSGDVGYATTPVAPYEKNEPLQCWWKEARQGKRFRVYRDGYLNTDRAVDRGVANAAGQQGTTITDADKAWDTDPQVYKSRLVYVSMTVNTVTVLLRMFISSHTATALTVPNDFDQDMNAAVYYIFDQPYQTYVLDLKSTPRFEPRERPHIDRFDLTLELLRYES